MKLNTVPSVIWRDPRQFIAFGFGVGALPFAPGTFATLATIPFYYLLSSLPLYLYIILALIIFIIGVYLCEVCSKAIGVHDHSGMVIDEMAGFLLTMIAAPKGAFWVILGFVLFRLFDIWKPWPISYIDENVKGGFGIMFDDFLAAVYAFIIIQIVAALLT